MRRSAACPPMPSRAASLATTRGPPDWSSRRTAAVLIDCASASSTVISPRYRRSKSAGLQLPMRIGASSTVSSGRTPVLQRGQPDERLERRTGLPPRQHRAVERTLPIVAPTHHRLHRAGGGIERHDRALRDAGGRTRSVQQRRQAGFRDRLQTRIERGAQRGVGIRRYERLRLFGHPVGEPAGGERRWRRKRDLRRRLRGPVRR